MLPYFFLFSTLKLGCEDTPSWDDGYGGDCNFYAANKKFCNENPWYYNRPDFNCCACSDPGKYR